MAKWLTTAIALMLPMLGQANMIIDTKDGRDRYLSGVTVCYAGAKGTFAKGLSGGGYPRVILPNPHPVPVTIYAFKEGYQTQRIRNWRDPAQEPWLTIKLPKLNGRISAGPKVPQYCDQRQLKPKKPSQFKPKKKIKKPAAVSSVQASSSHGSNSQGAGAQAPETPATRVFRFSAWDAYKYARPNGFNFHMPRKDAGSACDFENWHDGHYLLTSRVSAVVGALGAKCEFVLFDRRRLNPGWTFHRFYGNKALTNSATLAMPRRGDNSLRTKLRVWCEGPLCKNTFHLKWIELRGPSSADSWKEAFD